jgi:hypothetical protein
MLHALGAWRDTLTMPRPIHPLPAPSKTDSELRAVLWDQASAPGPLSPQETAALHTRLDHLPEHPLPPPAGAAS